MSTAVSTARLVAELLEQGVELWTEGGKVRYRAARGVLTPAWREQLLARKAEVAALVEEGRRYALSSFAQQRLWFLDQLEPSSAAYNVPAAWRLEGALDVSALARALREIVRRHETLRTTFTSFEGRPFQAIAPGPAASLAVVDLGGLAAATRSAEARRQACRETHRGFDLATGPLLRASLLRLSGGEHHLLLNLHHAVTDGWSMGVFLRELSALYRQFTAGRCATPPLADLPIRYLDFARWQRRWLSGETLESRIAYWKDQLGPATPRLRFPTDRPRPDMPSWRGRHRALALPPPLVESARALGRRHGASLFMTLLSGFMVLLHRYTGQRDLVVGSPIANRNRAETEGLIGFFVNMLVLRGDLCGHPRGDPTFEELLERIRKVALGAYRHQDLPFEKLVDELAPERDLSRHPIFQVTFALHNFPRLEARLEGLDTSPVELDYRAVRFDMEWHFWETGQGLDGLVIFATDLYDRTTADRLSRHFETLLESLADEPEKRLSEPALVTRAERHQLVTEWNDSRTTRTGSGLLHRLFETQAERAPAATAVVSAEEQLSYRELGRRARRLARFLRGLGVGPEVTVAICMDRRPELVVTLLGVLEAGGAYVPLDPDYPAERLAFMLEDCRARVVVTEKKLKKSLPPFAGHVVCLDVEGATRAQCLVARSGPELTPAHPAYLLYTSGSTGRPKGVVISHGAISNHMLWMQEALPLDDGDRVLQKTSTSFDASVWEFWAPLLVGARLILARPGGHRDPAYLVEAVRRHQITILQVVPSLLSLLVEQGLGRCRGLRRVFCGGEPLAAELERRFFATGTRADLVNVYGPTEATIHASFSIWRPICVESPKPKATLAIGRPIANVRLQVLCEHRKPVPVGVPGELFVSGTGLARGYLSRPRLNAERFIPDPFGPELGGRLYNSGDRVRRLSDGNLEYLGRGDRQVKLRGFRIELGEIETVLREHTAIREAVVVARETPRTGDLPDGRLVAFLERKPWPACTDLGAIPEPWEHQHVRHWQEVYESLYDSSLPGASSEFLGWNSSFTGRRIPAQEMREWLEHTVERILALEPDRVLEIGCGTGLLVRAIAPRCTHYVGTDFSRQALATLESRITGSDHRFSHVRLFHRRADDLEGIAAPGFDTVVLNSVVQYFPSITYLSRVLNMAVAATSPGGSIFVGDVRCLPLLDAFYASAELHQATASLPLGKLRDRIHELRLREKELVIDPAFFEALRHEIRRISHVRVRPKRGRYPNELNLFRYDVTLQLDRAIPGCDEPVAPPIRLDWYRDGLSLPTVRRHLDRHQPAALHISRVPNPRLATMVEALAQLRDLDEETETPRTVADLRRALHGFAAGGIDPEELYALERSTAYCVELSWADCGPEGHYDLILGQGRDALAPLPSLSRRQLESFKPGEAYANHPLRAEADRHLIARLRDFAARRLPEFMLPSLFILKETLPRLPNGKVDRRALGRRALAAFDSDRSDLAETYAAPRNDAEKTLTAIWSEVLGVGEIGVHDNFFELGGHSLLATQVLSRVRRSFHLDLPLRSLFDAPTVARLAVLLGRAGGGAAQVPLERVPRHRREALSFAQQRLWFLDRLEPGGAAYSMPAAWRLRGALDTAALTESLRQVVRRHEVLRTTFPSAGGRARQLVAPTPAPGLTVADLEGLDGGESEALHLVDRETARPFDLAEGPLARFILLRLAACEHILLANLHHIVSDAWSHAVLLRELSVLYEAFSRRRPSPLPELAVQYADYSYWQRRWLAGETLAAHLAYWRQRLSGVQMIALPTDRPRAARGTRRGARRTLRLPARLGSALSRLSSGSGASLFMVLLAAFMTLLHRSTGQHDLVVGTPVANRNRRELESLIGLFVNLLALRGDLGGNPRFRQLVGRVREVALGAFAHQDLPFEKLVEELRPERDLERNPFFQVTFALRNTPRAVLELPGLELSELELAARTARFDLALHLWEAEGGLGGAMLYRAELFDPTTLTRLARHFENLLLGAVADPEVCLADLPLLGAAEHHQVRTEWNDSGLAPGPFACLHELFEARAAIAPEAVALVFRSAAVSYRELDRRADRVTHRLCRRGVGLEGLVGLSIRRSPEMVSGLLGILKAGGAYLPLDPSHPTGRLRSLCERAGVRWLVTEEPLAERFAGFAGDVLRGDSPVGLGAAARPCAGLSPGHLAYVVHTSGSTGHPKGVLTPHRAVVSHLDFVIRTYGLSERDTVLQTSSASFDMSIRDLLAPLLAGARVILAEPATASDPAALLAEIRRHRVTCLPAMVPTVLKLLLAEVAAPSPRLDSVRLLLLAGESLALADGQRARELFGRKARVVSLYGPTEATGTSTHYPIEGSAGTGGPALLGRPDSGVSIRLLDRGLRPVPIGIAAELHLGGVGLARGYLGQPGLTAERFLPDSASHEQGRRLYRTGDLARYRPDGHLEFLGRRDQQLKIRGWRIEPGEIEALLERHPGLRRAVVVAGSEPGAGTAGTRLVACFVPRRQGELSPRELRRFLGRELPEAMLPTAFVELGDLPRTPTGKMDRRKLSEMETGPSPSQSSAPVPPRTPFEEILAAIWSEVLGVEKIGAHDNFFELGGHSLLATLVVSRLRRRCRVDLPLRSLFEGPTVAQLAARVAAARGAFAASFRGPPLERVSRQGELPLSFGEQRVWSFHQRAPTAFNMPAAWLVRGTLDRAALEASWREIVRRHEVLRTSFPSVGGRARRIIAPPMQLGLPTVDLGALDSPSAAVGSDPRLIAARRLLDQESARPFDLARGPLFHVLLLRLGPCAHVLFVKLHHIISDHWSSGVLVRELGTLYEAFHQARASPLPELPIQYADFAVWQRRWLERDSLEAQLSYWRRQLNGLTHLRLPTDRPQPALRAHHGAVEHMELSATLTGALRQYSYGAGLSLFMALLATFMTLLYRHTGQHDVAVGTSVADRSRNELEGLIGFFVNDLVLRGDLSGNPTCRELFGRVRKVVLEAFDHRQLPYDRLVEELLPGRTLHCRQPFRVRCVLQNAPRVDLDLRPGLELRPLELTLRTARIDLALYLWESAGRLHGVARYSTELFDATTVRRLTRHFKTLVESSVSHPEVRLRDLPFLSPPERHQVCVEPLPSFLRAPHVRMLADRLEIWTEQRREGG